MQQKLSKKYIVGSASDTHESSSSTSPLLQSVEFEKMFSASFFDFSFWTISTERKKFEKCLTCDGK